jgi:peptidoglycan/LPS O-acetylase OafA/YrhL
MTKAQTATLGVSNANVAVKTIIPIQALRAVAALAVILHHYSASFMVMTNQPIGDGWKLIFYPFGAGVDVFLSFPAL